MSSLCSFCSKNSKQITKNCLYKCPRCNCFYCGLDCYKSSAHMQCSENFYRDNVLAELKLGDTTFDRRENPILHNVDKLVADGYDSPFDSEDEADCSQTFSSWSSLQFTELDESALDKELEKISLRPNEIESLLDALNDEERLGFEKLLLDQNIEADRTHKTRPSDVEPLSVALWWRYVTLPVVQLEKVYLPDLNMAKVVVDVKLPNRISPCLKFNIANLLASYCCFHRCYLLDGLNKFTGQQGSLMFELLRICAVFRDAKCSFISASAAVVASANDAGLSLPTRIELLEDLKLILNREFNSVTFVIYCLCDLLKILTKFSKSKAGNSIQRKSCSNALKKTEFFLAWYQQEGNAKEVALLASELMQLALEFCSEQTADNLTRPLLPEVNSPCVTNESSKAFGEEPCASESILDLLKNSNVTSAKLTVPLIQELV